PPPNPGPRRRIETRSRLPMKNPRPNPRDGVSGRRNRNSGNGVERPSASSAERVAGEFPYSPRVRMTGKRLSAEWLARPAAGAPETFPGEVRRPGTEREVRSGRRPHRTAKRRRPPPPAAERLALLPPGGRDRPRRPGWRERPSFRGCGAGVFVSRAESFSPYALQHGAIHAFGVAPVRERSAASEYPGRRLRGARPCGTSGVPRRYGRREFAGSIPMKSDIRR